MRTIIEHAWVLTMDPQNTCYKDGYVIIEGSKILKAGEGPSPLGGGPPHRRQRRHSHAGHGKCPYPRAHDSLPHHGG